METLKAKDSVRKVELANIICSLHKKEKCTAYCKSCSKELCTFCVLEGKHQGHQILKLETVYNEQVSELNDLKIKMEDDLSFFNENLKKMELRCQEGAEIYDKAKQKIIQREKDMKEIATRESEILSQKLNVLLKPQNDALNKTKETLQKNIEHLKHTTTLTDQILHSNDAKLVFDIAISIKKELPSKDIKGLNVSVKSPVEFIASDLSIRFGSLVIMPKLAIIQSVQTALTTIICLASFQNGTYVSIVSPTSSDSQTSLEYFQLEGSSFVVECKSSLECKPCGMKVIENNRILLLCQDKILSFSKSNKKEIFFQSHLVHCSPDPCMCITAEGNILLGCNYGFFIRFSDAILVSNKGFLRNIFPLKYHVAKIAANEHGIYMIISHSSSMKAVQGLSTTFELKWTYEGHRSINSKVKFEPMDIAVSAAGLIYVTDKNTSSIHVLTPDGDFVANYGKEHGIIDPEILHINKEGQLIIWCNDGKIHVANISS